MLQQVKIYRPDEHGVLQIIRTISQKEVVRMAEAKITQSKSNWKKKRETKRDKSKQVSAMPTEL